MRMDEMITGLRHIGIIVKDVKKSVSIFKHIFDLKEDDIRIVPPGITKGESSFAFIPTGGIELELIQPLSERFREMIGTPPEGINHFAYTVKDIDEAVKLMGEKGVRLGHVTKDGILDMGQSKVAYFNPEDTDGILIEFVEPKE